MKATRSAALKGKSTKLLENHKDTNYKLSQDERRKLNSLSKRMFKAYDKLQHKEDKTKSTIQLPRGLNEANSK